LRGKLQLQEEMLFIEEDCVRHLGLQVDQVPFTIREMESCAGWTNDLGPARRTPDSGIQRPNRDRQPVLTRDA
jgi:hypothetical protein